MCVHSFQVFQDFPVVFVIDFQFDFILVRVHILHDFNSFILVKVSFMACFMFVYFLFGECSMVNWEKLFCCCWVVCFIHVNWILLIVLFRYSIFLNFLPNNSSVRSWRGGVLKFPTIIIDPFLSQLLQFLLHVSEALWFSWYTFSVSSWHIGPFFITQCLLSLVFFFALKFTLSDINVATLFFFYY